MTKKTGLGKGLDALFGDVQMETIQNDNNEVIKKLKITEVEPNREQPRKKFDQEALEGLADSIKTYGIIQPIVVSEKEGYYSIIAGERRWRAAKLAGLTEVPVIVKDNDERTNKEIALIENIQREDLNVYEKAFAIKGLMQEYSLTQEEVAKKIGRSRSSVANTVRILNLSPDVLEFAKEGKLTEGHCKALMTITDPKKQYDEALKIIEKGDSVRVVEKKLKTKKANSDINQKYGPIYKDIENTFQGFFGTKVKLDAGRKKGKIIIEYNNNEDLERMLHLIK